MKKLLFILCFLPSLMFAQSQSEAIAYIQSGISKVKSKFPEKEGSFTLCDIYIKGQDLIIKVDFDESVLDLESLAKNLEGQKHASITLISAIDETWPEYFYKSNLNFVFEITGSKSHQTRRVLVTSEEIKKSYQQKASVLDVLETTVSQTKSLLPQDKGKGLSLIDIYIKDGYLTYCFQSDGTIFDSESLLAFKSYGNLMEETIIKDLNNPATPEIKYFNNLIQKSGLGVKHIYSVIGKSETVTFIVSPEDIKNKVAITL